MAYKVSPAGRIAIEGREGVKLAAYLDSVAVWTIGVGHTGRMSFPAVYKGMTITRAQADAYLSADLAPVEAAINALNVVLTQNQVDALASFIFNIGVHGFVGSAVAKSLKSSDYKEAALDFLHWEKPAALVERRESEVAQFRTPDAQPASTKPAATVAVAPASQSDAAPKKAPMTQKAAAVTSSFVTSAEKSAVSFGHGILNIFEGVGSQLATVASTLANKTTSSDGTALPTVVTPTSAVPSTGDTVTDTITALESCAGELVKLVNDARTGNIGAAVSDGVEIGTAGMALLAKYGVSVGGLSSFIGVMRTVEAFIP